MSRSNETPALAPIAGDVSATVSEIKTTFLIDLGYFLLQKGCCNMLCLCWRINILLLFCVCVYLLTHIICSGVVYVIRRYTAYTH